jgi:hypothetical protein
MSGAAPRRRRVVAGPAQVVEAARELWEAAVNPDLGPIIDDIRQTLQIVGQESPSSHDGARAYAPDQRQHRGVASITNEPANPRDGPTRRPRRTNQAGRSTRKSPMHVHARSTPCEKHGFGELHPPAACDRLCPGAAAWCARRDTALVAASRATRGTHRRSRDARRASRGGGGAARRRRC